MLNNLTVTLSKINIKSIDINLSYFSNDMEFKLYDSTDALIASLTCVDNSRTSIINNKTLIIPDSSLLTIGNTYTIRISSNNTVLYTETFIVKEYPAPLPPVVTTFGNRILQIQFPYPIKNLNEVIAPTTSSLVSTSNILANFYIKFFNVDESQVSTSGSNLIWPGYILAGTSSSSAPFLIELSADFRTLTIECTSRSLPIGSHTLQVAASKLASHTIASDKHLSDFDDRYVPTCEVPFTLTPGQFSSTITAVNIVNPITVEVTFNNAVISTVLDPLIVIDKVSSISIPSIGVTRKSNTLNTLVFTLENPIIVKENVVTVPSVIDCFGLSTSPKSFEASLQPPELRILSVIQSNSASETITKVAVTFSNQLQAISANTSSNYVVTKKSSTTQIPVTANYSYNPDTSITTLTFNSQLSYGVYTLTVNNLVDIYDSSLTSSVDFSIIDLVRPTATILANSVTTINSTVLIKFDEPMAISPNLHGIDLLSNYMIKFGANFTALKPDTSTNLFMNDSWVKFNFTENLNLTTSSAFSIGYLDLTDIKYVTDLSNNIVSICAPFSVGKLVDTLDISNGVASVVGSNQVVYTLNLNQTDIMFDPISLNKSDFAITIPSTPIPQTPTNISLSDDFKSITLTFTNINFNAINSDLKLVTVPSPQSLDFFNQPILGSKTVSIINNSNPKVNSISTVWVNSISQPTEAVLSLMLSRNINLLNLADFIVYNGSNIRLNITSAQLIDPATGNVVTSPNASNIIELKCSSPINTNALVNDLLVSTTPKIFRTTGFNLNKLEDINNMPSVEVYPISYTVVPGSTANSLKDVSLQIKFNKNLTFSALSNPINGTIDVIDTDNPNKFGEIIKVYSLNLGNIIRLNSNVLGTSAPADDTFAANLSILNGDTLSINFTNTTNIDKLFSSLVYFELLPVGYLLLSDEGAPLNESITIKIPFTFEII